MKTNLLICSFILFSISSFANISASQIIEFFNIFPINKESGIDFYYYIIKHFNDNLLIDDSSCQREKHKYFRFNDKLNNLNKIKIDSLLKKYRVDIDKYLNEDLLKRFDNNFPKFWNEFPEFDKKHLEELLKELKNKFDKDSLLNKFRYFKKKNLFNDSEIIEI